MSMVVIFLHKEVVEIAIGGNGCLISYVVLVQWKATVFLAY